MHFRGKGELASPQRGPREPRRAAPTARFGGRLGIRTGTDEAGEDGSPAPIPGIVGQVRPWIEGEPAPAFPAVAGLPSGIGPLLPHSSSGLHHALAQTMSERNPAARAGSR